MGLRPSLALRSTRCFCGSLRFLHLFCPECGVFFDVKKELINLNIIEDDMGSKGSIGGEREGNKRKKAAYKAGMQGR